MQDIDPKHLRAFLCVADERSFSAAARRLCVGRGTITRRVQALERKLGARLLDRGGGSGIEMTEVGARLLPGAREVMEMHDMLVQRAAGQAAPSEAGPPWREPAAPRQGTARSY